MPDRSNHAGQGEHLARSTRAALRLILVVVFINIAGFSVILPLLPFYGRSYAASTVQITLLFSAYSFGNLFGEIYWGRTSDRIGRKRVLTITTAVAAISYIAFAYATSLWLALAIRVVSGFFSGTLGVCQGYIADVTRPEDRARKMGLFAAALNLGIAVGPAIGGLLARPQLGLAGYRLPIFASAAMCALSSVWCAAILAETRAPGPARPLPHWAQAFAFVARTPLVWRMFTLAFVGIGSFASMEAVFGVWTAHNFGWTAHQVGLTFVAVGLTGAAVQMGILGRLSARFGEARVIVGGLAVLAASMALQPLLHHPVASVVLMSTLMAGHSLTFPSVGALISRATAANVQGSVLGLSMATNALARITMPPLLGLMYSGIGRDTPYYACAAIVAGAIALALQAVRLRDAQLRRPS